MRARPLSRHRARPPGLHLARPRPSVSAQERTTLIHAQEEVHRRVSGRASASGLGRLTTVQEARGCVPRPHPAVLSMELERTASHWRIRPGIGCRHPPNPRRGKSTDMATIAIQERGAGPSESEVMTWRISTPAVSITGASRATRSQTSTLGSMRCNHFCRWVDCVCSVPDSLRAVAFHSICACPFVVHVCLATGHAIKCPL